MFGVPESITESPSHTVAREPLVPGDSVLDIGCGGGIAAFAIANSAHRVVGIDHQSEMLAMFSAEADRRSIQSKTHQGFWPAIANSVEIADVVTCHHVVYNVQDIAPFIQALTSHARKRVVIEMPQRHPLTNLSDLWLEFWNLERPSQPTPAMLMDVLSEMGINSRRQDFDGVMRDEMTFDERVSLNRIRLCLTPDRDAEIADAMRRLPQPAMRKLTTIWWDTGDVGH